MTKSQYLDMCEQMGEEPNWEKCPPDIEDFPQTLLNALNLFYSLGDRIYPDIVYLVKDFTNFNFLLNKFGIEIGNGLGITVTGQFFISFEFLTQLASQLLRHIIWFFSVHDLLFNSQHNLSISIPLSEIDLFSLV
mgnify:CR=1 FL=1